MTNPSIELNGKKLKARELTFAEVELVLESLIEQEIHPIETIDRDAPVPATAIALSIGVEIEELSNLTPSGAAQVIKEVQQTNPFLCEAIENLAAIATKTALKELKETAS